MLRVEPQCAARDPGRFYGLVGQFFILRDRLAENILFPGVPRSLGLGALHSPARKWAGFFIVAIRRPAPVFGPTYTRQKGRRSAQKMCLP
jgi:hypothetical protein